MRALVILALCATAILAIDVDNQVWTKFQQKQLVEIKQTQWGNWILDFAELHLETEGGLLGQLVDGVAELIHELEAELDELNHNFSRRTDNHNRDVQRLTQEIEQAQRDVFNANDLIDNVLYPQRDRLQKALKQLRDNINQNRKALNEETLTRKKNHDTFTERAHEHQEGIDAVDQCLTLLNSIANPSLVQIKKVQSNLQRLEKSFNNHSIFTPLIRALIELATEQNFADQGALKQIVTAFNDLRVQLVNSLNEETAAENVAQSEFEARVVQLNGEHADFQRQVLFRNAELNRTIEKLAATDAYLVQRKQDLATLSAQINAENDDYARETDIYNNLVAQYNRELTASNQAFELLTQPSFTDYVKSKLGF